MIVPRPAATIALVRDGDVGRLEVYLLRRSLALEFAPGATVFPGGGVADGDHDPALVRYCDGRGEADASLELGYPPGGLAFWLAAVRECFEEVGILLAVGDDGRPLHPDATLAHRLAAYRAALLHDEEDLRSVCERLGVRLDLGSMRYFGHWITPPVLSRRYDTRFFVAPLPDGQTPDPDRGELVAGVWCTPDEALEGFREGRIDLITPTERTLVAMARFDSTRALLEALDRHRGAQVPLVPDGGGLRARLPGDDLEHLEPPH